MGKNRTLGAPLEIVGMTASFRTAPNVDQYLVDAPNGTPVDVTLDPNAFNGDRVEIADIAGNAMTQPINVVALAPQTIVGFGASLMVQVNFGGVVLTYNSDNNAWVASLNCCGSGEGGEAFVDGGNAFGSPAVLGTTDANTLDVVTNNTDVLRFATGANQGQLQAFSDGTASNPIYSFHSNTGDGYYHPASGVIGFALNSNEALTFSLPSAGVTDVDVPAGGTLQLGGVTASHVTVGGASAIPDFPFGLRVGNGAGADMIDVDTGGLTLELGGVMAAAVFLAQKTLVGRGNSIILPTATLHINGSLVENTPTVPISTNYAVDSGLTPDLVLLTDTTAAILTITLPAAPAKGRVLTISDSTGQAGAHAITVDGNGQNINGAATQTINSAFGYLTILYTGLQWVIIGNP